MQSVLLFVFMSFHCHADEACESKGVDTQPNAENIHELTEQKTDALVTPLRFGHICTELYLYKLGPVMVLDLHTKQVDGCLESQIKKGTHTILKKTPKSVLIVVLLE